MPNHLRICGVEEVASPTDNGNRNSTVRDRLCQVIRQHQLDPNLVKAYATDFCSVKTLRDANRDQVENFVKHLAGLRRTATPSFASSTAIPLRKKVAA